MAMIKSAILILMVYGERTTLVEYEVLVGI